MSVINFLSRLGCFVGEKFLSAEQCRQLKAEVFASGNVSASIVDGNDLVKIAENVRSTKVARVSKATLIALYEQMLALKPEIEQHFNIKLTGCEVPQILIYRKGDFFNLHKDQDDRHESKTRTSDRKVSIVVFLNEQSREPHEGFYCGGSLNLYGLVDQPDWKDKGFPLGGLPGLLIAFRSNILHEVAPVTYGKRLTVVNWFY